MSILCSIFITLMAANIAATMKHMYSMIRQTAIPVWLLPMRIGGWAIRNLYTQTPHQWNQSIMDYYDKWCTKFNQLTLKYPPDFIALETDATPIPISISVE